MVNRPLWPVYGLRIVGPSYQSIQVWSKVGGNVSRETSQAEAELVILDRDGACKLRNLDSRGFT